MKELSFFKSKTVAWTLLIIVIIWLVSEIIIGGPCWYYIPVFFAFMSAFCNLASIYLTKVNIIAAKKLEVIDILLGIAFLISTLVIIILP